MMRFHARCGKNITLLEDNLLAVRSLVEFYDGLVFSEKRLMDDVIFEIQIKGKITIWNGGISIGVTTLDPSEIIVPSTSARLKETAWIMSGTSILKDGIPIVEKYCPNLDKLREDDCLGILKTSWGELLFYVNGKCLGVAVENLPEKVFAVLDLYGQCVKIRIKNPPLAQPAIPLETTDENLIDEEISSYVETSSDDETLNLSLLFEPEDEEISPIAEFSIFPGCMPTNINPHDNIRFHPRCGSLIKLSTDLKRAERALHSDEYNNGVILSHRPLHDNELFQIRIDKVIDKWSGSIEMGVTTHNPENMRFPSTMTNMDSGTIMMSGSKILVNGYGTCTDYGNVNLDELGVEDKIALRRIGDKLHFYINGEDQGVAAENIDSKVWGVVDLYGMTVKVSIIDEQEDDYIVETPITRHESIPFHMLRPRRRELSLAFHSLRYSMVFVIDGGKAAHRPFSYDCVNNGLVMTNRTLKTDELFQIRLEVVAPRYSDSIAIGVTQMTCNDVCYPYRLMTEKRTWALIGSHIIKDGEIVIPHYVRSIDRLVEGDTIGVMRKDMGILHFYVNGVDQGPAAFNVPEHVFGILEMHGKLVKATIVDTTVPRAIPANPPKYVSSKAYPKLCFHNVRGPNGEIDEHHMVATRETKVSEYNYCIFFSSRPLREYEMFEVRVDKLFKTFGTLSIGMTGLQPDDIDICNIKLANDLPSESYILNGRCLLKSSNIISYNYPLDLNLIKEGTRVGVMWHPDGTIHFYKDDMDYGPAFNAPRFDAYAVIDLFGPCTQVALIPEEDRSSSYSTYPYTGTSWTPLSIPAPYSFSEYCGHNIVILDNFTVAQRWDFLEPASSLVFSASHLVVDEIFEVKILYCHSPCAGSIRMGVTDINILNAYVNRSLPTSIANLPHYTAYIAGTNIMYTNPFNEPLPEHQTMFPSLDLIRQFDTIGLKKTTDQKVRVYINSEPTQTYFEQVPDKVYVVMELYGSVLSIEAISKLSKKNETTRYQPCIERELNALEMAESSKAAANSIANAKTAAMAYSRKKTNTFSFMKLHGNNIRLFSSDTVAIRTRSYNNGVVIIRQRLKRGHFFMFRIDKLKQNWIGGLAVGAISSTRSLKIPMTAIRFKNCNCWIISEDCKNICGKMVKSGDGSDLENINEQSILKLVFDWDNTLVLVLDDKYRMNISRVPKICKAIYPILDLYGKIKQVSILFHSIGITRSASINLPTNVINCYEDCKLNETNNSLSLSENNINLPNRVVVSSEIKNLWLQKNLPAFTPNEMIVEEFEEHRPGTSNSCDTNILREVSELPTDVVSTPVMNPETVGQIMYFTWLISITDSLEANKDLLNREWQTAADSCPNMRDALDYWKSLTAQFIQLGAHLSQAHVHCYCDNCDPAASPHLSGWIRIERKQSCELEDSVYWHPDREVFDVPYSVDALNIASATRPEIFHGLPKIRPDHTPLLWYNEDGIPLHIRISTELTLGGHDQLNAIMFYMQTAPLRNEMEE